MLHTSSQPSSTMSIPGAPFGFLPGIYGPAAPPHLMASPPYHHPLTAMEHSPIRHHPVDHSPIGLSHHIEHSPVGHHPASDRSPVIHHPPVDQREIGHHLVEQISTVHHPKERSPVGQTAAVDRSPVGHHPESIVSPSNASTSSSSFMIDDILGKGKAQRSPPLPPASSSSPPHLSVSSSPTVPSEILHSHTSTTPSSCSTQVHSHPHLHQSSHSHPSSRSSLSSISSVSSSSTIPTPQSPPPARPTPIHPAALHTTSALTVPPFYKPTAMYDPATATVLTSSPYMAGHLAIQTAYPPQLHTNPLYSLPYGRPEYAIFDRHNGYRSKS